MCTLPVLWPDVFLRCRIKQSNPENSKQKTRRDPSGRLNIARTRASIKSYYERPAVICFLENVATAWTLHWFSAGKEKMTPNKTRGMKPFEVTHCYSRVNVVMQILREKNINRSSLHIIRSLRVFELFSTPCYMLSRESKFLEQSRFSKQNREYNRVMFTACRRTWELERLTLSRNG